MTHFVVNNGFVIFTRDPKFLMNNEKIILDETRDSVTGQRPEDVHKSLQLECEQ